MEEIGKHNYEAFLLDFMEGNLDESGMKALLAFFEQHPDLKPEFLDDMENLSVDPPSVVYENKADLKHEQEALEERIVSYLDGQLNSKEKQAFELQLQSDPSLQTLLIAYEKTMLSPANDLLYGAKSDLKRTLIPEETIIAYSENVLSPSEKVEFEKQLASDEVARNILTAYQLTRLEADKSIVYADKAALKRGGIIVYLNEYWKPLAIAASIVLLFGLFWLFSNNSNINSIAPDNSLANKHNAAVNGSDTNDSNTAINKEPKETAPSGSQYAHKNAKQNKKKESLMPVKKDEITPGQQPLATTNNKTNIDTNASVNNSNALAMVNLNSKNENNYSYNYYSEREEDAVQDANTRVTTKEYVAMKLNQAAWGEDEPVVKKEKKKFNGFGALALIGKGLKKLGNKHSDVKKVEAEDGQGSEYVVTIGGVSVKRKSIN
ncbi:MAG TPA: hypothetical protein VGF30_03580 [Bacteroidia bacterium]